MVSRTTCCLPNRYDSASFGDLVFFRSLQEEAVIDYMRWVCRHTHTRRGEWTLGPVKSLCVAVVVVLGPFSSGAFVSHPKRASSQRHKETGKRRESEGELFFFFTLSAQCFFFFDFKENPPVLERPLVDIEVVLMKAWLSCHTHFTL